MRLCTKQAGCTLREGHEGGCDLIAPRAPRPRDPLAFEREALRIRADVRAGNRHHVVLRLNLMDALEARRQLDTAITALVEALEVPDPRNQG